jgi:zinc protease
MFYNKLLALVMISGWCLYSTTLSANGEVEEFTLDNGLKLIVKVDHRAPVVVSQIWYKVGSSYEVAGKTGLSHLLEHMMFKGTQKYPAGEFSRIMAKHGASENAFTHADYTSYFQTLEKSRLPISLEMEADRMRHLVLNDQTFAKEKQVVLEERRSRVEDKPISLMWEHFQAAAYQTSPSRNPVIGWLSDIKNCTLADLQTWYQRWYAPNNATVVVVGDVKAPAVLKLVQQYFGSLKPSQITPPSPRPETQQWGIKRITVARPAKLPYLAMGYKTPSLGTLTPSTQWKAYALEVLAYILDGNNSARLAKHLVRGNQIATVTNVDYSLYSRLTTLFSLSGIPTDQHTVAELETALREQIQQLQTTLVTKTELERIKVQLQAKEVYKRDSLFYQGMQIGILTTVGLDWRLLDKYLDNIKAVTPEQIQQVAQKYLVDKNLTVAVLEPQPLADNTPTADTQPTTGVVH